MTSDEKKVEKLIEYLKQELPTENEDDNDPDGTSWGYQQGILISHNQAREVIHYLQSLTQAHEEGKAEGRKDFEEVILEVLDCPYTIDPASVPKSGIEVAPEQVVGMLSIGLLKYRKLRSLLPTESRTDGIVDREEKK